ncbi:hypothetical protein [Opitutus sp. ER46]|uniref:hypothetical protein n=1 Tax=Opitutus sp. ER46 TaxID=2161864 RepID=UPI000D3144ED|nr:hypothetical protein [Opitutus sp. ER46]PTX91152.1 hypothetical protein DB354_21205 [Opitutus sp. ER46]
MSSPGASSTASRGLGQASPSGVGGYGQSGSTNPATPSSTPNASSSPGSSGYSSDAWTTPRGTGAGASSSSSSASSSSFGTATTDTIPGATTNSLPGATNRPGSTGQMTGRTAADSGSVASSTTTESDTQVTSVVHQLDAQGPAIVERITTQVGAIAGSSANVRNLVESLHHGTPVTLTTQVEGQTKTATFTPVGTPLSYGEAAIAVALAAEQLRNAGVTTATPEQWQAALIGGSAGSSSSTMTGTNSTSASSRSSTGTAPSPGTMFPGILTLRAQGQGWGQIAQTTNVRLGQVVNFLNPGAPTATGLSSAEMNRSRTSPGSTSPSAPSPSESTQATPSMQDPDALRDHRKTPDKEPMPEEPTTPPER